MKNCSLALQGQLMGVLNTLSGWSNSTAQKFWTRMTVKNNGTELNYIYISHYMIKYSLMAQYVTFS